MKGTTPVLGHARISVPKYVASTTLKALLWNNSTLLGSEVPRAVAALKDTRSGGIQVHGSWGLLQTLIEHDLIDDQAVSDSSPATARRGHEVRVAPPTQQSKRASAAATFPAARAI